MTVIVQSSLIIDGKRVNTVRKISNPDNLAALLPILRRDSTCTATGNRGNIVSLRPEQVELIVDLAAKNTI